MNRLQNRVIGLLLRAGVPMGAMALLTVAGRVTGRPRHTPIAIVPHGNGWRLLATYGIGDWVRNLRAAGTATLTFRGARIPVSADELTPAEAAPIIHATIAGAGPVTRRIVAPYFDASTDDPVEVWEQEAVRHPLFRLAPLQLPAARGGAALWVLTGLLVLGIVVQVVTAGASAFGLRTWDLHGTLGVVTEAVALATAVTTITLRRIGIRWLAVGIFTLITVQHGTAAIGGLAGGLHALNSLLMLLLAATILRRLRGGRPVPAAHHARARGPALSVPV